MENEQLLQQANSAYNVFTENGPLFGKKDRRYQNEGIPGSPPTWKIAAEPQWLPERYEAEFQQIGRDIYQLANALKNLPEGDKALFGNDVSWQSPSCFRIDTIFTKSGPKVNEIQISDGADALMVVEQMAYGLQTLETSTAATLAKMIEIKFPNIEKVKIALLWNGRESNYLANSQRMNEMISKVSDGKIAIDVIFQDQLQPETLTDYQGVINYANIPPSLYNSFGILPEQVISDGDYSALDNKGIFALLFDEAKREFWIDQLGDSCYQRLLNYFIPTWFISSEDEVNSAKINGNIVIKAYAVSSNEDVALLDSGQSVFGPWDTSSWERISELMKRGIRFIGQQMETPLRLKTFLRTNKGKAIEQRDRYNRICAKYVVLKDQVVFTAAEATLGETIKPTGRDTSFAPVQFARRRKDIRL